MVDKKFKNIKFLTFDIESRGFDKFLLGGIYDGKNFKHTEKTEKIEILFELIFSSPNYITIAYAHFGGIFDFIHIIDFLFHKNTIIVDNIIMQGSKILKMDITYKNRTIQFVDSSGLFPFSLEKLSKSFGVHHEKINFDVSNLKEVTPELIKYLEHDCVGLYECLEKYFNKADIREINHQLTRSGISFNVFKEFNKKCLIKYPDYINEFSRKSYMGGRCEIFKPLFNSKKEVLYHYDINSLYPSVMRENDYCGKVKGYTDKFNDKELGIYKITIESPKILAIPVIGIKINGKFLFPLGTITGYYTSAEIKKSLEVGYKIKKVHSGIIFENQGKIFKNFVDHYYQKRLETSCPVEKIIYKDILNHLYGRIGINQDREEISFIPNKNNYILSEIKIKDYVIRLYAETKKIRIYSAPAISSFVTSYARLKLYSYFEQVGFDNCYYCDTDSLFTTKQLEKSNELGKMKLEAIYKKACFLLPKSYSTIDLNNVQKIKLKGIPEKSIGHIDIKTFFESISGELRLPEFKVNKGLAKIKTGFRKNDLLSVLGTETKRIKKIYDKRIIFLNDRGEYESKPRLINGKKDIV